ncbi:MAG: phosphate signaling complex PhoU family protein [Candidatus Thorarchaeota archaeon]|jgi:phosphate transport system protein
MRTQLEIHIEEIGNRLKELHELSSEAFMKSMKSFEHLDQEMASEVKGNSQKIEELSGKVEANVFETIARRQPVASDLRRLATYLQVAHHLHRVGRYAYKIAHIVKLCEGLEHFKELQSLPYVADLAKKTLDIAMRGVLEDDLADIDDLEKMESDSDRETSEMFEEIAEYLRKRKDITTMAMFYVIVGRYCERAADQAFAIAERAVYMVTGEKKKLGLAYKGSSSDAPH